MELPIPPADIPVTTSTSIGAATGAPHLPYTNSTSSLQPEPIQPTHSEISFVATGAIGSSTPRLVLDESTDLSTFDILQLNPNAPQKYASAFEAYCLERDARAAAAKIDDSQVPDLCVDTASLNACVQHDMLIVISPPTRYVLYFLHLISF